MALTGQTVPLGGIVYGSSILVLEVTVRMLWALAQRKKDMDQARQEGRQEGRESALRELVELGVDLPPKLLKDLKESARR